MPWHFKTEVNAFLWLNNSIRENKKEQGQQQCWYFLFERFYLFNPNIIRVNYLSQVNCWAEHLDQREVKY
jgi:hypothetical protein